MKVYIVVIGVDYEGNDIDSVYLSRKDALARQEDIKKKPEDFLYDVVEVREYEVKK